MVAGFLIFSKKKFPSFLMEGTYPLKNDFVHAYRTDNHYHFGPKESGVQR
jgi:hypothetical protein